MDIKTTKRTLINSYMAAFKGLSPRKSWLITSRHGMGKSQVMAQIAAELSNLLKLSFGFIDIRLGQYEIGDLLGLQRIQETYQITNKIFKDGVLIEETVVAKDVAVHDLPLWFPRDPNWHGIIFFDEINRGSRDTQQWAFQAVLDYRCNFVDFPAGAMITSACNDDQEIYNILNLDPALFDRFGVIKFNPTVPEWNNHAEQLGVHLSILRYVSKFPTDLDPPEAIEPGIRYPSRRSWVSLSEQINAFAELDDDPIKDLDYLHHLAMAWLGDTVTVNFVDFVKKEYKVYLPDQILAEFSSKLKNEFKEMIATDITWYNRQIVRYIAKNNSTLTPKQHGNLADYFMTIPRETANGFWADFSRECRKQTVAFNKDPQVEKYTRALFNKTEAMKG